MQPLDMADLKRRARSASEAADPQIRLIRTASETAKDMIAWSQDLRWCGQPQMAEDVGTKAVELLAAVVDAEIEIFGDAR